ncbi:hypothetical protein [Clostridium phage cpp]|uniref:Uncharacterized protein n=1 Tax=Clostridium phage cpp TaxID=3042444 RepID=A0AAF0GV34_9CAUD|nr:hypothetical protein [Clostridium phage cpp]
MIKKLIQLILVIIMGILVGISFMFLYNNTFLTSSIFIISSLLFVMFLSCILY